MVHLGPTLELGDQRGALESPATVFTCRPDYNKAILPDRPAAFLLMRHFLERISRGREDVSRVTDC